MSFWYGMWDLAGALPCHFLRPSADSLSLRICDADPAQMSAAAVSEFVFGLWTLVLGLGFAFLTVLTGPKVDQYINQLKAHMGFPVQRGPWLYLFSMVLVAVGLTYLMAARLEITPFFWMTVFGRVGVFMTCLWIVGRFEAKELSRTALDFDQHRPRRRRRSLLLIGLIDLLGAGWTAANLMPPAAASVFIFGIYQWVFAAGFKLFPSVLLDWLGFASTSPTEADRLGTWDTIFVVVLVFFGSYYVLAGSLNLVPFFGITIVTRFLFCATIALTVFLSPVRVYARPGTRTSQRRAWPLLIVAAFEAVGAAFTLWFLSARPE